MGDEVDAPLPTAPPLQRPKGHRPAHFVVLSVNILIAVICFIGAGALVFGQQVVSNQKKTAPLNPTDTTIRSTIETAVSTPSSGSTTASDPPTSAPTENTDETTVTTDFPQAEPDAKNFLITGSDNGGCPGDDGSGTIGDRNSLGERSDTIMIMRVNPQTSQAAILSFPRDLYVSIAGTNRKARINSAYKVDEPQRLVQTIQNNFYIPIDHYIQIDFCAFKVLVDAVGGVAVPFEYPVRDSGSGLNIPEAGCHNFSGDEALDYVRSRKFQWLNPDTNKWQSDNGYDYGRIARQQDFLRRAVAKVVSQGPFDLSVAQGLIDVAQNYVVTDQELTIGKQLEFAGVLKNIDAAQIHSYRVEGNGQRIAGEDVIVPTLTTDNMVAILAIFRGSAALESAPEQAVVATDTETVLAAPTTTVAPTTTTAAPDVTTGVISRPSAMTTTTQPEATTTTLATVTVDQATRGLVPPADQFCP